MKLQELLKVMIATEKVKVVNSKDKENVFYEGIKAGCLGSFVPSEVEKITIVDGVLFIEIDYQMSKLDSASNEELYDMYFDESEADMDIAEMEERLQKLQGELSDILFDL